MRKKRILSEQHKKKISFSLKGKKKFFSQVALENIRKAAAERKGIKTRPRTQEEKEKIRAATLGKKKNIVLPNPSWFPKGHIPWIKGKNVVSNRKGKKLSAETIQKIVLIKRELGKTRSCWKSKEWARLVKNRDGNKCTHCGSEKRLHAHHIVRWKENELLRWELSNGKTLCVECHGKEEGFQKGHAPCKRTGKIPSS